MTSEVRTMFDRIAPRYDLANRVMSVGVDLWWRRQAVRALALQPGQRILDLACGTGDGGKEIARTASGAETIGVDFSDAMLRQAVRREPAAPFLQADARALPFAARSFDAAFCAFGLRNVPELPRALAELARVLRPGARLVVLEFFRSDKRRFLVDGVARTLGGMVAGDRAAYRYLSDSIERFCTTDQFVSALSSAGFADVEARPLFPQGVATIVRGVAP